MAKVNSQEYVEKWARRTKGASEDYRRGVERVTEAPGKAAAKAQTKMINNFLEALNSGKWANAVESVSLEEWQSSALNKGLQRIAAGVEGATTKQQAMAEKLLANIDAVQREVSNMPSETLEDNIARMTAWARGMNKRKLK